MSHSHNKMSPLPRPRSGTLAEQDERFQAAASDILLGHIQNLQDRLGLRDPQMAEVLADLADWFSEEVRSTNL